MSRARDAGGGFGHGVVRFWKREVGDLSPRAFARFAAASEDLVLRLGIHRKLDKHRGCVNTVSFNADGDILVSGSDDRMIILWNWDAGLVKLSFHSGHTDNVFQAKFMPYTDDRTLVTCAADGEVRHVQILERGQVVTKMLAQHEGRVHKMAIEPGSPHIFYSCGEDGLVQHFDLRTQSATKLFVCKSFIDEDDEISIVQLNAIAIDPRNPNLFAVAGSDEYVQLYDIRKYKWGGSSDIGEPVDWFCPHHLIGDGQVGITGLAFSEQSELLASYNDELIYLFTRDQGLKSNPVHKSIKSAKDINNGEDALPSAANQNTNTPQAYEGHRNRETVKGVSFYGPSSEYVASGSDCGRLFIWRKKDGELLRVMEGDRYVVNCIEPHPYSPVIASSGIENDVKIWTPNATERAPPVNMEELKKRKRRSRFRAFSVPEDMIAYILALQRRRSVSSDNNSEDHSVDPASVNIMMNYTDGDVSLTEAGESSENSGDCIVN
ncbi:WD repeat-containing protein 42A protein [Dioscorea alata]|uniref:WD repeat-containing protein 42A protein n=1 Tax=Dioscorea alata TaxID=55571 RepID=A0ACB7WNP2_DIOAL|nr:WD repeat-containing protein 42A protein [Dioscorea alata]